MDKEPIGVDVLLALAVRERHAANDGNWDRAKLLHEVYETLKEEFPEAENRIEELYPTQPA